MASPGHQENKPDGKQTAAISAPFGGEANPA